MRGTLTKLNRRKANATPHEVETLSLYDRQLYMSYDILKNKDTGKTVSSRDHSICVAKPHGTWKQFWARQIGNISKKNRLPRGFN